VSRLFIRSPSCSAHNEKHKIRAHIKIAHKNKLFYSSSLLEPPNSLYGRSLSSSLTRFYPFFLLHLCVEKKFDATHIQTEQRRAIIVLSGPMVIFGASLSLHSFYVRRATTHALSCLFSGRNNGTLPR
jgi:hypothetical protein